MWYTLALFSALFSALAAVGEKSVLREHSALRFSALLTFFVLILSIPFLFFIRWPAVQPFPLVILYGKSVLGACSFFLVMRGIRSMELSSALPLLVITPGLVAILSFLFLGERLSLMEIVGMVLLLGGTYILQIQSGKGVLQPFRILKADRSYAYIIGAILIFTITSLLDKTLLGRYRLQPEAFFFFQHLFLFVNFMVVLLFQGRALSSLADICRKSYRPILLVALLTIGYRYFHILAVKAGPVALVLSLKRTSVFMATVFGGRYFGEHFLLRKGVATAVMVAGAVFILVY